MKKKLNGIQEAETLEENYPNEATFKKGSDRNTSEENYFRDHDVELVRKKYIQFTVYMEAMNQVMELGLNASVEDFAFRIRDLVEAAQKVGPVS